MVLWLCLQLSRGEPVWGLPVRKTDVIYLALEDNEWRIQQRMQELTDSPPENLHFGFSCGRLGAELEAQIEGVLSEHPGTGIVFIDTLQMIRDNATVRSNVYAQDYKELSSLKKLADRHGICIFIVHHTRKERDRDNIFNDLTGSTGIMGVADTVMVLRKANRFGSGATLYVTGRDIEEQRLELDLRGVHWEVVQALDAESIQRERIPDFLYRVADYLMDNGRFEGTVQRLARRCGLSVSEYVKQRALNFAPEAAPPRVLFSVLEKLGELDGVTASPETDEKICAVLREMTEQLLRPGKDGAAS